MNLCDKINELIPLFITNDLNSDEYSMVNKHLEQCRTCKKNLEELSRINRAIAGEKIEINPMYGANLVVNINNAVPKSKKRKPLVWAVPALSALAIFLVVIFVNIFDSASLTDSFLSDNEDTMLFAQLTNSGFFNNYTLDETNGNTDYFDEISLELNSDVAQYLLATEDNPLSDDYVVATANLSDEKFDLLLQDIEEYQLW